MVLRLFTERDVDLLLELDSDPEVMRWLSDGVPTPREVIELTVLPGFTRDYGRGFGAWAAIEKETGAFLGWFSLRPREHGAEDEAELGYRLRREVWGRGFATEGARALIERGFSELGLNRVFATTYEENVRSRRVMERLGMTLVRTYRMTPDQLARQQTYTATQAEAWPGADLEYAISVGDWVKGAGA